MEQRKQATAWALHKVGYKQRYPMSPGDKQNGDSGEFSKGEDAVRMTCYIEERRNRKEYTNECKANRECYSVTNKSCIKDLKRIGQEET